MRKGASKRDVTALSPLYGVAGDHRWDLADGVVVGEIRSAS